ncbi:hypothetical protein [Dethiosulfovibrio salsuginis]|uniref:Uncharacterized protein n=1 Tax=Dethiosulfovibrio salsuginis TaxID=561720 RepID=A0A1X7IFP0_9BACT|nr:hypothetical protein [Dethiosulfovibrio salsuginis]SMG13598.1 hypothetical protein SAMN06275492_10217 [Dethiosulfovibrio salsuginis]
MKIDRISKDYYSIGTELWAEKKEQTGKARIKIKLPYEGILFQYDHKIAFLFDHKKRADGIVFAKNSEGWALFILEIKKTVGDTEWRKIKDQWYGAWLHAKAISGILELDFPKNVSFVVAYEKERIVKESSDPILLKLQTQENHPEESKKYLEWTQSKAELSEIGNVSFKKITLNDGEGLFEPILD